MTPDARVGVSIVVPTYDRPERLARCLRALAAQDVAGLDLEVVVVDDGGRVSPEAVVASIADQVDVRLHRQANAGPAAARNAGARIAVHEALAFTDDDCVPDARWARSITRPLADDDGVLIGGSTTNAVDRLCADASQYLIDALYRWFENHPTGAFWTSNNMACSSSAFADVGGFDETFPLPAGEDRELGVRWARSGRPLARARDAFVDHHHDLDLARYWRQHRNYGRGAAHYRDVLESAGDDVSTMPPSFYATLLAEPFRHEPVRRALPISALIALSQVATVAGFAAERTG